MYGLEKQKNEKTPEPFVFDLETELKDRKKHKEIKDNIENRIQQVKQILQSGEDKGDFDKCGLLLHGYTSLLKVIARCIAK